MHTRAKTTAAPPPSLHGSGLRYAPMETWDLADQGVPAALPGSADAAPLDVATLVPPNEQEAFDRDQSRQRARQNLAKHLRGMREEKGLTQEELAHRAGLRQSQIARMESPLGPWPTQRSINAVAEACEHAAVLTFPALAGGEAAAAIAASHAVDLSEQPASRGLRAVLLSFMR